MNTINWEEVPEHEVLEGLYGKFIHTDTMTIVRWRFEPGADLPIHHHIHEQITTIESGTLELQVGEERREISAGDVVPIASNVEHGGKAMEATIAIDIFHPVREDFREKFS